MSKDQLLEDLQSLLSRKKSKKFYADKLGITSEKVENLMKELRESKEDYVEAANYIADLESQIEVNNDKGTWKSTVVSDFDPKSDEELIALHKINTDKYKLSSYWSKQRGEKFTSSVFCTLKKPSEVTLEDVEQTLQHYKSNYVPLTKLNILINQKWEDSCSAFIDLTDFHLDKQELGNSNLSEKVELFYKTVDALLYKAHHSHKLEEIVFVVGSDFFHADTYFGTTTNGTPVYPSLPWNSAYELGFDMHVNVINKLKQFCNSLKVILVQGNHDKTKSYYLAHGLMQYFRTEENIQFDINPAPRKVHVYGQNFIGLHHGNCKIDALPLIFAQEFSLQWGPCKHKEIKVGDKHFYMEKEIAGVRIKQLPSLSGTDEWHNENNFVMSTRSAICSVYHPTKGRISEFEERV